MWPEIQIAAFQKAKPKGKKNTARIIATRMSDDQPDGLRVVFPA
jgi:hypothetical protein